MAKKAAPKRRMGPENAVTRMALMDAAENVLREQGYAALSARSVAARAGLKYQIVFYYFETMDDLLVATYQRNCERMWPHIDAALKAERPLHALWALWSHPFDGAIALEFLAMANHNKAMRAVETAFTERLGKAMKAALPGKLEGLPGDTGFTPLAISGLLAQIGAVMSFQQSLGLGDRRSETRVLVERALDWLEPAAKPKRTGAKKSAKRA